ncbi:hypothetical protein M5K25_022457 [Dendrobium thyrsiflorum]|uniref:Uncharacterized protein n=1 Tax=Dendrobium thyrsiflorum TaxID=117978 RepID=A0ABD0U685_DENTH
MAATSVTTTISTTTITTAPITTAATAISTATITIAIAAIAIASTITGVATSIAIAITFTAATFTPTAPSSVAIISYMGCKRVKLTREPARTRLGNRLDESSLSSSRVELEHDFELDGLSSSSLNRLLLNLSARRAAQWQSSGREIQIVSRKSKSTSEKSVNPKRGR